MIRRSKGEKVFAVFNYIYLSFLLIVTLYPCLYVVIASVSDPIQLYNGSKLLLWPRGFNLSGYEYAFTFRQIWVGYRNTIFYTIGGTALNVVLTIMAAYCLSRRNLWGQNFIIMCMVFTMYFSGGMIPMYMVVKEIHLLDSPLAMILPGAINTTNFIIALTYFRGMPYELEEAAKIDGAGNFTVLFKILAPLAKPVIMVLVLYYSVEHWNDYMNALLYIFDQNLYPLQSVLREILIQGSGLTTVGAGIAEDAAVAETIKYAIIVISTVPILCVYPFIQKYFVKGVMMGALKG